MWRGGFKIARVKSESILQKTGEVTHPEVSIKDKMDEAGGDPHFFVRYYSNPEWAREISNGGQA